MLFRRRTRLAPEAGDALARILAAPTFELIPLEHALDQTAWLPAAATTCASAPPAHARARPDRLAPGGRDGVRHRLAGQGCRSDRRAVRAAPGPRVPRRPAPV